MQAYTFAVSLAAPALLLAAPASAAKLYWSGDDAVVRRANLDGSDPEVAFDLVDIGVKDIEADGAGGKLFFTSDFDDDGVWSAAPDGSGLFFVGGGAGSGNPRGLALDLPDQRVYWAEPGSTPRILRAPFTGGAMGILEGNDMNPPVTPSGIDVRLATGQVYWTDPQVTGIRAADLDGSNPTEILGTTSSPVAFAINERDGFMYWSRTSAGIIYRTSLASPAETTFITGLATTASDIEIDLVEDRIYWLMGTNVQRADLDGSNVETILTGLTTPRGIAIFRGPPTVPLPWAVLPVLAAALVVAAGARGRPR